MSYTRSEVVSQTSDITETIYIFSSATDSTYANDPYCRVLDLMGKGWVYRGAGGDAYANVLSGGTICSGIIEYPGRLYASAGATVEDMTIDGHTYICDPRAATGVERDDITLRNIRNTGNVEFVLRGSNVKAYDVAVLGRKAAIQNGAYVEGLHISGGTATMEFNTGTVVDSNATTMIGSNFNVSAGALNVSAGAGKTINIYGLNANAGAAVTIGYNVLAHLQSGNVANDVYTSDGYLLVSAGAQLRGGSIDAGTIHVYTDALASGVTVNGGTMNASNGAEVRDIVVNGGTLSVKAGGLASGGTIDAGSADVSGVFRGGTVNAGGFVTVNAGGAIADADIRGTGTTQLVSIGNGGTGSDLRLSAGRINNYGTVRNLTVYAGYNYDFGGSISGLAVSGGTATIQRTTAVNDDVTVNEGGLLNVYNATVTGLTQNGGTVSAVSAANYAATYLSGATIGGGTAVLTTGVSGAEFAVGGGELQIMESANVSGATLTGGMTRVSGGAMLRDVDVRGTGTTGVASVYAGATAENIRLSAGRVDNYGTVRNLTVYAGYNYTFGGSISGLAVSGGSATIQRTSAANDDVTVNEGALLNIYNAEVTNLTLNGGTVSAVSAGTFAAPKITGAEITGGAAELTAGALGSNIRLGGGLLNITNATVKDLVQTDGKVVAASGADLAAPYISNAVVSGGTMTVSAGALAEEVRVIGTAFVYGSASNVVQSGGSVQIFAGGSVTDFTQVADGKLIVYGGGAASNVEVGKSAVIYDSSVIRGASVADGAEITVSVGGLLEDAEVSGSAFVRGSASGVTQYAGRIDVNNGIASNFNISGGYTYFYQATAQDIAIYDGSATIQNTTAANLTVHGGLANIYTDIADIAQAGGSVYIANGATVTGLDATGGKVGVANGGVLSAKAGNTVNDLTTIAGAKIDLVKGAMLTGENTGIAEGTLYFNNSAVAGHATSGVIEGLTVNEAQLSIGSDLILKNAVLQHNSARISAYGNVVVSGATLYNGGLVCNGGCDARIYDVTITRVSAGQFCTMNLSGTAEASNTVVENGGALALNAATVKAENTTLRAGGVLNINASGADTGKLLTLDVSNGGVTINNLGLVKASTEIVLNGETAGNTYTIATTGATDRYVNCGEWGLYDDRIKAGESVTNAFTGFSYAFNATGTAITVDAITVGTKTGDAAALTSDDAITGGRAVKWDSATGVTSGNVFLAGDMTSGQAWVELDGYAGGANTTLYGAQGNSFATGTVNVYAKSGSLRNLAAGANAGGTVAAVNLTVAGAELDGTGYAGGFGNVTGAVKTLVSTGTITKDFYAGALANKLDSVTSVGNVSMTVDGGTFSGNIYGASAVKTVAGKNGTRHTAGDVTLTITDGETTKGTQSCIFAGGYATGDATGTVYTVDSVTATISGGSWGTAAGGRGIFGGVMASGVTAQAGNVNLTVSGGSMGNVYGGGWSQKTGGKSIVGDVNISIEGGTIANVFGGGSHSSSGGTTETGDITITVSGGNITGDIYARGQLDGDTTGAASVIFTGANDFDCGVFGYSYVGGAASDAALSFSGYTGAFSGNVGGFDNVTFADGTAMTLSTESGNVSNGSWVFDLTDRAEALAGTSLLTWSGADFANDTVKVSFADETQAKGGWNIAAVAEAFSGTTFDVEVGGTVVADNLAYSQQIAGGDYAGWGFDLEGGVLKFKQLA